MSLQLLIDKDKVSPHNGCQYQGGDMPDLKFEDAILTRRYDLSDGGHVDIYVWKPEPDNDHLAFSCWYQIHGLEGEKPRYACGIDSVQAQSIAMQLLSAYLYNSDAYKAGQLTYLGTRDLDLPHRAGEKPGTDEFEKADLLTTAGSPSVVLMPDQRFPYIAWPGERLNGLVSYLDEVRKALDRGKPRRKLKRLIKGIAGHQKYYEAVCRRAGHDIAYTVKDKDDA